MIKNDSLTNGMQTFFLFYNQTIAKLMFIMHKRVLWSYEKSLSPDYIAEKKSILLDDISNQHSQN